MPEHVECGQVQIGGKDPYEDLTTVRTAVRFALYGKTRPVGAVIEVVSPAGEISEWEFGPEVGYPTNQTRNWLAEWVEKNTNR